MIQFLPGSLPGVVLRKYLLFTKTVDLFAREKKIKSLKHLTPHGGFCHQIFLICKNYFPGSKLPTFSHSA